MSYELSRKFGPLHKPYVPANSGPDGYLEAERPGLKHYAGGWRRWGETGNPNGRVG